MAFELKAGEEVLAEESANLFRGIEAVGGRITITTKRIIFQAHMLNLQTIPAEIPLEHIEGVSKWNTLGFIPNGLLIRIKAGGEYKFVVNGRNKLLNLIESHLTK